jgi:CysZ protein
VLGFGVAVQLCFLVPGGAIVVMPAAVAAATHLTRDLLAEAPGAGSA